MLLNHERVNVALTGRDGMTVLHCAVTSVYRTSDRRSDEEFEALREAGLRVLLTDPRFDVNARVCIEPCVLFILSNVSCEGRLFSQDFRRRTPLHLASDSGAESFIRILLDDPRVDASARDEVRSGCLLPNALFRQLVLCVGWLHCSRPCS